jgi:hypothetical protein
VGAFATIKAKPYYAKKTGIENPSVSSTGVFVVYVRQVITFSLPDGSISYAISKINMQNQKSPLARSGATFLCFLTFLTFLLLVVE